SVIFMDRILYRGLLRLHAQGAIQKPNRSTVILPPQDVEPRKIVVGRVETWVYVDGVLILLESSVVVRNVFIDITQIVMDCGIVRAESQRPAVILDGSADFSFLLMLYSSIVQRTRDLWTYADHCQY